ncbi:MAG: AIR synthase family protein [Promethearchaeota archaeon]
MVFPPGKIPVDVLRKIVFEHLGTRNPRLLLAPGIGEDAAIIKMNGKVIVVTSDPITGSLESIGWLSVHINANDIATCGAVPLWYLTTILLPEKTEIDHREILNQITSQIDAASKELNITVAGGHTEITPGINRPIVIGFMVGETEIDNYVTSNGAKPGDQIIVTKSVGLEGTSILAEEMETILKGHLKDSVILQAKEFIKKISVVKDSQIAMSVGGVNAMHDPTEGGIFLGLHEIADASHIGLQIEETLIPVAHETEAICEFFEIDPFQLISSGCLIISASPEKTSMIIEQLESEGIAAMVVGEFVSDPQIRKILTSKNKYRDLPRPTSDHLWRALEQVFKK